MNIVVYCGAKAGNKEIYVEKAKELGLWIAKNDHVLIYGAGGEGIMGAVSNTVLDNNGKALGIIPCFMVEREWENKRLTDTIHTKTMSERREKMLELGDVFVALPGGIGTIDEISEAICMAGLMDEKKPCIIFNVDGYYDSLKIFFDKMYKDGFFTKEQMEKVHFIKNIDELTRYTKQ